MAHRHRRSYGRRFLEGVISRAYHTGAAKEPFQQPSESMAIACDLFSCSVIALFCSSERTRLGSLLLRARFDCSTGSLLIFSAVSAY